MLVSLILAKLDLPSNRMYLASLRFDTYLFYVSVLMVFKILKEFTRKSRVVLKGKFPALPHLSLLLKSSEIQYYAENERFYLLKVFMLVVINL